MGKVLTISEENRYIAITTLIALATSSLASGRILYNILLKYIYLTFPKYFW